MTVGLVCLDRKAGVQQQHSVIRPWCEQTSILRRRLECWIVLFQGGIYVLEGRWCRSRWTDGKAQPVRLVVVVVRVLAKDDSFDGAERRVTRPR